MPRVGISHRPTSGLFLNRWSFVLHTFCYFCKSRIYKVKLIFSEYSTYQNEINGDNIFSLSLLNIRRRLLYQQKLVAVELFAARAQNISFLSPTVAVNC